MHLTEAERNIVIPSGHRLLKMHRNTAANRLWYKCDSNTFWIKVKSAVRNIITSGRRKRAMWPPHDKSTVTTQIKNIEHHCIIASKTTTLNCLASDATKVKRLPMAEKKHSLKVGSSLMKIISHHNILHDTIQLVAAEKPYAIPSDWVSSHFPLKNKTRRMSCDDADQGLSEPISWVTFRECCCLLNLVDFNT